MQRPSLWSAWCLHSLLIFLLICLLLVICFELPINSNFVRFPKKVRVIRNQLYFHERFLAQICIISDQYFPRKSSIFFVFLSVKDTSCTLKIFINRQKSQQQVVNCPVDREGLTHCKVKYHIVETIYEPIAIYIMRYSYLKLFLKLSWCKWVLATQKRELCVLHIWRVVGAIRVIIGNNVF